MSKIVLGEIVGITSPFQRVRICRPKNAALGFKIAMIIKEIQPAIDLHREKYAELLERHGAPVEGKPDTFHFRESEKPGADLDLEKWEPFETEYNELLLTEIEAQFVRLTLDDLDAANIEPPLSPDETLRLFWLIDAPGLGGRPARKRSRKRKEKD